MFVAVRALLCRIVRELHREVGSLKRLDERRNAVGVVVPTSSVHVRAERQGENRSIRIALTLDESVVLVDACVSARHS
jgi:hypothetical protein